MQPRHHQCAIHLQSWQQMREAGGEAGGRGWRKRPFHFLSGARPAVRCPLLSYRLGFKHWSLPQQKWTAARTVWTLSSPTVGLSRVQSSEWSEVDPLQSRPRQPRFISLRPGFLFMKMMSVFRLKWFPFTFFCFWNFILVKFHFSEFWKKIKLNRIKCQVIKFSLNY